MFNRYKIMLFLDFIIFAPLLEAVSQNNKPPMSENMQESLEKEILRKELYRLLGRLPERGPSHMGSTIAWWLAALNERIKVCVDINCLTDFHTLLEK